MALELVRGSLHGRRGSFILQHSATMTRGAPDFRITVLPDSGTEELSGLSGNFDVIIEGGKHSYAFVYQIG